MKLRAIIGLAVVLAIVGVVYIAIPKNTGDTTEPEPRPFVWDFDMEALRKITISLPKEVPEESVSFVQHEDRYYYFDVPNGPKVDMVRWGGGIPLILSGPGAERLLFENASDANLDECGLNNPNVYIQLTLNDEKVYEIDLGDKTPSGQAYYIRIRENRNIYTVDYTWYDVVSRLITEPPYAPAAIVVDTLTVTPLEATVNQTVVITAEAVNNGTVTGTLDVRLKVNAEIVQTQTVELTRDQRQTVTFTIKPDKAGTYSINVEGKTAKLTVK